MKDKKKRATGISPFIVSGVLLVLMSLFVIITRDSIKEHDARIVEKLTGKGTFLLRAFEAGTRMGMMTMRWRAPRVQSLLTETAFQPEVNYLMIITEDGKILAHSDPEKIGTIYANRPDMASLGNGSVIFHREITPDKGIRVFEVFKVFTPARRVHGPKFGGRMGRMMKDRSVPEEYQVLDELPGPEDSLVPGVNQEKQVPQVLQRPGTNSNPRHPEEADWFRAHFAKCAEGCRNPGKQIIIAGLDMEGAEFGKKQYLNHVIINGAVLFLIGSFGIVGLFVLQGYRSTRSSLSRVRAFSNKLVETMPAGLIAVDLELEVTSCNREAMVILGEKSNPVLPDTLVEMAETMEKTNQKISRDLSFTLISGDSLVLDVIASPIWDDENQVSGYLFLFRDLTEITELKNEVERSRRLAAVGKLAAGVAHEIRNPLSSIKGFATYFRERYKNVAEDRETADIMVHEVERLNRSITQLLEFARPVPVVAKEVDLELLVAHSLKLVENDLASMGITVQKSMDIDMAQKTVITDPDRLNQILLNLYLNAIQAMEKGGILGVKVSRSKAFLFIEISDTGRGITLSDMDKIFDPYFTTRTKGTGLGLAMVHRNLEAMDAEIRVESREKQGTTFFIKLPCNHII